MTIRVYCSFGAVLLCMSACLSTTDAGVVVSGQCPATLTVEPSHRGCTSDRDCCGGHKCCPFPCGPVCVPPVFMKPGANPPGPPVKPASEPPKPPVKPGAEPARPPVKPGAEPARPPGKPGAETREASGEAWSRTSEASGEAWSRNSEASG
ncbi:merozoite surface protein CMZ-8-like [Pimephales promelas]|uniref:merozoite surface protein CMZ-8-like n=1 Tax=Pimephales promelas TaxID=90988 RepID=UPI001955E03E|nr:merozoite surface protein CMZ-8-like [Pimephales promelas]